MRRTYIGLQWKFFIIIYALCVVIAAVFVYLDKSGERNAGLATAMQRLSDAAQMISAGIPGEDLNESLNRTTSENYHYEVVRKQVRKVHQTFSATNSAAPISRTTIILPGSESNNESDRVYYATRPFTYLEEHPRYPELTRAQTENKLVFKDSYVDGGNSIYSVFAPVYGPNQKPLAVARVDMQAAAVPALWSSFWLSLTIWAAILLILGLLGAWLLSRIVTRPIDRYVDFVNTVSEGNYHLRLEMHTQDELEKIGHALNVMLEKQEGLIHTEADRDRLQQNITHLLRIVSAAANGDFTVSAEVTADTLGALADSFNLMVADLSKLLGEVQQSSEQVEASTRQILQNTELMSDGADEQAKDIENSYAAAKEMAEILKYANVRTSQAAESARRAAQVAMAGSEVVKKLIDGMHAIRERVQENARRVRVLGESSVEIGEIIEMISDIANRTNLLALNATIEAARAGEAGRGFAVVADEVRMLAERASQAAKDIAVLIQTIQDGTKEAVSAMEIGTDEVEKGTRYVDEAGTALKEIIEMVQDSSQSITEISGAFQQQTKASVEIVDAVKRTALVAQDTAKGAKKSRDLAEEMENISRTLNQAVSKFRLKGVQANSNHITNGSAADSLEQDDNMR